MPITKLTFDPSTESQRQFVDCMKELGIELPMDFLVKTYNTSLQEDAYITLMSGDKVLKHSAMMTLTIEGCKVDDPSIGITQSYSIDPVSKSSVLVDSRITTALGFSSSNMSIPKPPNVTYLELPEYLAWEIDKDECPAIGMGFLFMVM